VSLSLTAGKNSISLSKIVLCIGKIFVESTFGYDLWELTGSGI
jgi:hypothetical protein